MLLARGLPVAQTFVVLAYDLVIPKPTIRFGTRGEQEEGV